MEKQRDEAEASVRLWRDKALAAVKAGYDALAREALAREAAAKAQQAALEQSLLRLHQSTNALQEQLALLRQRKLEAHTQRRSLSIYGTPWAVILTLVWTRSKGQSSTGKLTRKRGAN